MNKFVVFSDLHLHTWGYGSSLIRGRNSRLMFQQLVLIDMLGKALVDPNVTAIIFCGDFFHTHGNINAEVLQSIHEIFKKVGIIGGLSPRLVFLLGNHDMVDKRRSISALSALAPYGDVVTEPMLADFGSGHRIGLVPYFETKEELVTELNRMYDSNIDFLFLHQGISGVPINSTGFVINEALTPEMIPNSVLAAFAGHYHSHKQVSSNLWIPGSMNQLTWTDVGEDRGWLEVTYDERDSRDVQVKHIPTRSPKFMYKTDKDILGDIRGNYVRIDCSSGANVKAIKEEASKYNPLSIEIRVTNEKPEMVEVPKSFSTLMDLFHEYLEANDFSPEFVKAGKDIINAAS